MHCNKFSISIVILLVLYSPYNDSLIAFNLLGYVAKIASEQRCYCDFYIFLAQRYSTKHVMNI